MSNNEELEYLWRDACAAYEEETDRKLNHESVLLKLKTPDDLLTKIQSEGQAFQDWRNKHSKLWSSLKAFLGPVAAFGSVAIEAVKLTPWAPAAAVLGSVFYLITSCEQVSNAYDWVEQVFAELQEFSDRLTQYSKSTMDAILRKKVAAILVFILRIIGRSEYLIRERRFREYLRVTFLGKDEKTRALLDDLNRCMANAQSYTLAVTYSSSKAAEEGVGRVEKQGAETSKDIQKIGLDVENLSTSVKESKDKDVQEKEESLLRHTLNSTSALDDVLESFHTYKKNLLKGSGAWLQKEPLFNTWMEQKAPILWLFGGPGAGKSYLSTWTIMRLQERHQQEADQWNGVSIGYFFIKENKEVLREANIILKTLAWQIAEVDPLFKEHAIQACKSRGNTITAEDTWENLFFSFYQSDLAQSRYAILVLDGLDEASYATRTKLLGFVKSTVSVAPGNSKPRIQFAVVGRATLRGDMVFTREEKYIEVSPVKNYEDIDSYIRKRLEEVEVLKELRKSKPDGPRKANRTGIRIKKKVLDNADGVFLWAQLLLDQIVKKDLPQIEKILADPPHDLDEMIWSVFDRLAKDEDMDHGSVRKMLTWVAFARRPLFFGEIDLVLSLPTRRPSFLLWKSLRGRFSSIFDLKFPGDYDPEEADDASGVAEPAESDGNEEEEDTPDFDFTGNDDDDETDSTDQSHETGELFGDEGDRGLQALTIKDASNERGIHNFSDDQLRTIVTFSHQRIRDYLVREGSSRTRRKPQIDINIDVQRAQIDMTIACLEILRLGFALDLDTRYLVDYPAKHLVWHLESIDKNSMTGDDRHRILDGLYWLLKTPEGTKSLLKATDPRNDVGEEYDEFWRIWLGTNLHCKEIQAWFAEAHLVAQSFDEEALVWMKAASASTRELLKPLMMTAASFWLTKSGYNSREYTNKSELFVWVLHGYNNMDENGLVTEELRDWAWYKACFWNLEAEEIKRLADWAQLEHTTHWHTGLGWILMEGLYYEPAIQNFEKALNLDETAWVAMEGMARCWGEQGSYEKAIEYQEKALDNLPETMEYLRGYLLPRIAQWKGELGDSDGAYEAARTGYLAEPSSVLAQLRFIQALHRADMAQSIIENLEYLDDWRLLEKDYSYLVRFFALGNDAFWEIGKACRTEGNPEFILTALEKALALVDQSNNSNRQITLRMSIAFFRYSYYDQVDEPMLLWEAALKYISAKPESLRKEWARERRTCVNFLGQLYFDAAMATAQAGGNSSQYSDKLKGISVVVETSMDHESENFDFYGTEYPSMLWGCWMRDHQGTEVAAWRKCFKARLLEQMNMLDDDDPSNDEAGLHALAATLFKAGDRKNAGAILAILFKALEDEPPLEQENDGESEEVEEEDTKTDEEGDGVPEADENAEDSEEYEIVAKETPENEIPTANEKTASNNTKKEPSESDIEREDPANLPGFIGPKEDKSSQTGPIVPPQPTSGLKLNLSSQSWMYTCDYCGKDPREISEMYFCEVCLAKNWCNDCLPRVKDNSLPWRQCNPNHSFYCAWPIPSEARDLAAEFLGGEVALRREWLAGLRSEWMK